MKDLKLTETEFIYTDDNSYIIVPISQVSSIEKREKRYPILLSLTIIFLVSSFLFSFFSSLSTVQAPENMRMVLFLFALIFFVLYFALTEKTFIVSASGKEKINEMIEQFLSINRSENE